MNSMIFEVATINMITICLIVFGAFAVLRIARNFLQS
jgi:hypothetical protein